MHKWLRFVTSRFARHRLIADRVDKSSPYLSRWYLLGNATTSWFLALHQIHKGDSDEALHTHPFAYLAIQLAGLMLETQPSGTYVRRPGYLRMRTHASMHRLSLPAGREVWSLFLGFNRRGSWGFAVGGRIVDFKEYLT